MIIKNFKLIFFIFLSFRYAHEKEVKAFNFNTGGDYFVSGGSDNLVMVWKTNFDQDIDGKN